ncbi:MAG: ribosome biogenesis GTPase Der [bacterium]
MKIAIVGRPNTGKSTLFNRLIGRNKAVTDDLPGVTRDRLLSTIEHNGVFFDIIDTGGYEKNDKDPILKHIVEQVHIAVEESDLILFVVDGKNGINPIDREIASILRKKEKDTILVINKVDHAKREYSDFYSLGIESVMPVSAEHALGIDDLLDAIFEKRKEDEATLRDHRNNMDSEYIKIAISGRPNTGKSTLLNSIIGEERAITSDAPGTTRDVIDIPLNNKYGDFLLLDTAGIRRYARTESKIESYSIMRSRSTIEFSDIALLVIDGTEGFTHQDKKVSEIIAKAGVGCLIIINKRDKMEREFTEQEIHWQIPFLSYAPILYLSAKYDDNFDKVFKQIKKIHEGRTKKISTGDLNRAFKQITTYKTPPMASGKEVKLKYMVQASKERACVPRFIVCGVRAKLTHSSYKKYLVAKLREEFGFVGNPIELIFKEG